jgi:MFS family permease
VVLARYQEVLRRPHVTRLLLTAVVARLPQGMSGLAIVLFVTPRFGYGRAGIATGTAVAAAGLSTIVLTRAVDRVGARRVLVPSGVLYAAFAIALAESGRRPYALQLLLCAALGLSTPPITSVARALWSRILSEELATVVYGLEATTQELIYIVGPTTVAVVAGLTSPRVALITSGVAGLVGLLAYVSAPPFAVDAGSAGRQRAPFRVRSAVIGYALVGAALTVAFGMTELATIAFVGGRQASARAGIVLAVWSAGSLLGGIAFGAAKRRVTDGVLARLVALTGIGVVAAAIAPDAVVLAAILALGGCAVAPTFARLYARISAVAGEGSTTEAFGWLALGFLVGVSAGSAVGGISTDAVGPRWTFVLAGAVALAAAPLIALRGAPVASSGADGQTADPDAARSGARDDRRGGWRAPLERRDRDPGDGADGQATGVGRGGSDRR